MTATLAQGAAPIASGAAVINEVYVNPPGSESGAEWVELYNPSPVPLNVDGWRLADDDGKSQPLSGAIPAFGYVAVMLDAESFRIRLANTADEVRLEDADGKTVDAISYGEGAMPAPGEGQSLARHYLIGTSGPAAANLDSWYVEDEPTPGAVNDRYLID